MTDSDGREVIHKRSNSSDTVITGCSTKSLSSGDKKVDSEVYCLREGPSPSLSAPVGQNYIAF